MPPLSCIVSVAGTELTDHEKRFFERSNPLGFILFSRNVDNRAQTAALVKSLKAVLGRECPILIDQEGGRVARLKPPHWHKIPSARELAADLAELERQMDILAGDLSESSINVNCAPVMDVATPQMHDVIGDRAYAWDPEIVYSCADIVCRSFLEKGVTPVIKHIPGHGRAEEDSHDALPVVRTDLETLCETDFIPFRKISSLDYADKLWAMTAHILFTEIDPHLPVSVSKTIIQDIIRTEIVFGGFLISDDLSMEGLAAAGSIGERGFACVEAGCDAALYCAGHLEDMEVLAQKLPPLSDEACDRLYNSGFPLTSSKKISGVA